MNNIKPRSRLERELFLNKDVVEKNYINNRQGYETRNDDAYNLIHQAHVNSDLFCSDN